MKLALGTAQFGLVYGVSNDIGKTLEDDADAIVQSALQNGIDVFDTAPAYDASESILGSLLPKGVGRVVTKTPHFQGGRIDDGHVRDLEMVFANSLLKLKRQRVYGLLIHGAEDLLKPGGERLWCAMMHLREQHKVDKIGVSAYSGQQIDEVVDRYHIDLIQLPLSVLDQRLITGGQLRRLKEEGVEIHCRSVFLQGLLLMEAGTWPSRFAPYFPVLRRYHEAALELHLNPVQLALAFVSNVAEVDRVVCGVNTLAQWRELVAAGGLSIDPGRYRSLGCTDGRLVDPRQWQHP